VSGWKLDPNHIFYWERGTLPKPGRLHTIQDISESQGRVVILSYTGTGEEKFFTTMYMQSYRTTPVDLQATPVVSEAGPCTV
jgi:hypothetical protein